jgi:hypothetical protein
MMPARKLAGAAIAALSKRRSIVIPPLVTVTVEPLAVDIPVLPPFTDASSPEGFPVLPAIQGADVE